MAAYRSIAPCTSFECRMTVLPSSGFASLTAKAVHDRLSTRHSTSSSESSFFVCFMCYPPFQFCFPGFCCFDYSIPRRELGWTLCKKCVKSHAQFEQIYPAILFQLSNNQGAFHFRHLSFAIPVAVW